MNDELLGALASARQTLIEHLSSLSPYDPRFPDAQFLSALGQTLQAGIHERVGASLGNLEAMAREYSDLVARFVAGDTENLSASCLK